MSWEHSPDKGNSWLTDLPLEACFHEAMESQDDQTLARKRTVRNKTGKATGHHEKDLLHKDS